MPNQKKPLPSRGTSPTSAPASLQVPTPPTGPSAPPAALKRVKTPLIDPNAPTGASQQNTQSQPVSKKSKNSKIDLTQHGAPSKSSRLGKARQLTKSKGDQVANASVGLGDSVSQAVNTAARSISSAKEKAEGTAPVIAFKDNSTEEAQLRKWEQRGFVELSPGKLKLKHRILPRTVIGLSVMLLAMAVGAAFAGASFYAYYDNRLAENERTVGRFVEGFDQQFSDASGELDSLRVDAVTEIRTELTPLNTYVGDAQGVVNLPAAVGDSVWLLETRGEDGEIVVGSAFAVVGHNGGTAMVTSYSLVVASSTSPSPPIELVKGNERIGAQLWAWDAQRDLALVVVDREIPVLEVAVDADQVKAVGARLFAMSGVGGQGSTASPGVLLDHSEIGLQHTAAVGTVFRGGPIVNSTGHVLGVASDSYRPLGIDPGAVPQAADNSGLCAVVLDCADVGESIVGVASGAAQAPPKNNETLREDTVEILPED